MSQYGTTEYNERFGERLRARMYERGKTAAMMSHDLKISKASISNWTTGKRLPRAAAMDAICRYLNCTRADLLEDEPTALDQTVQKPAEGAVDPEADRMAAVLDAAGYGRLTALFMAAKDADKKDIDFVTEILRNIQAKKSK